MKENNRDRLPDHGQKHALLIALFDAKKSGQIATKEKLKIAISEVHNDKETLITDEHLKVLIYWLRTTLQEIDSEFTIISRKGFGYEIKSGEEIKKPQ